MLNLLVRHYSKKIVKNPGKYAGLEKIVESARIPITIQELLAKSTFYALISFLIVLTLELVFIKYAGNSLIRLIQIYLNFVSSAELNSYALYFLLLICVVFALLAFALVRCLILSYPRFVLSKRKGEINLYLPHAVNMMYGMASGGISIFDMVKAVAESDFMFGELSKEFKIIVNLVETFEEDLISAMKYVRRTTPSQELSSLIDDLVFIIKGGGNLKSYFKSKSEELLQREEISYESYLDFLSFMSETYLAAFILFPLFLLVILVVMQITGKDFLNGYLYSMYIIIPVSAIAFMYLIKSSMPIPPARSVKLSSDVTDEVVVRVVDSLKPSFSVRKFTKRVREIMKFMSSPFLDDVYVADSRVVAIYVLGFTSLISYAVWKFYPELIVPAVASSLSVPVIAFFEVRNKKLKGIEMRIPEVFRELALLNEAGLSIIESIKVLVELDFGTITKELRMVYSRIEWGDTIARAFRTIEERVKSDVVARVIPVSIKVLEVSPSYKDAFNTVSSFANAEVTLRERIRSSMMLYVIIIYMSVFVFLVVVYVLINSMLSSIHTSAISAANIEYLKYVFFRISILIGVFSGLIAGVIGSGKVTSGLKHSYVFLMASYFVFTYLIK